MNFQFTLAARYLGGRKLRTGLTTLAIVFGVLVVFGMNTILPTMIQAFQANMLAAAGKVDATITHKTGASFSQSTVDAVLDLQGVRAAAGTLNRTINLPPDFFDRDPAQADRHIALALIGLHPDAIRTVRVYSVVSGRFLDSQDRAAAVISQSLADSIGVDLGDFLTLPGAAGQTSLTIVGLLPAKALPGNEEVLVTLEQAQTMFNMPGQINAIDVNFDTADQARREAILADIERQIGTNYQVGALTSGDELLVNIRIAQGVLSLLGVLALFMGGFIIYNTFRTIVIERQRDIGMLRAVGANRATILSLILTESLVQGVAGTLVGLVLGYALAVIMAALINPMLRSYLNLNLSIPPIDPLILAGSVALGIGFTLIAGLAPAIRASRVTPLEALRPAAVDTHGHYDLGFWSGIVMIALALLVLLARHIALTGLGGVLFFLGLILVAPGLIRPVSTLFARVTEALFAHQGAGQLAAGNLTRQPVRAAVTASSTMIGIAVVLMATSIVVSLSQGFTSVLKKSLGSDFILVPPSVMVWGSNLGARPELAEAIRALEGIETVSTLRFATSETKNTPISLLGIDPVNFSRVSSLHMAAGKASQAFAEMAEGRAVIANTVLAAGAGIKVGDEIALLTIDGERYYRVVGIGMDFLNAKIAAVYISQANMAADFGMAEDVMVQINLRPGADRAAAETQIRHILEPYPQFTIISGKAYLEQNQAMFDMAFLGMYALLVFLSVPSWIALLNTLAIGVIERTREIGMLRAVGATRRQIRTVILAEALILAAIGTSLGLAAGLYLGYLGVEALSTAGFPLEYIFPASGVAAAVAAGLLAGALAAIIPARQAARLEVVQALRYE